MGREGCAAHDDPRPGHADLTAAIKYGYRATCGQRWSAPARAGRPRCASRSARSAGLYLAQFGITIGGYVVSIGEVDAQIR